MSIVKFGDIVREVKLNVDRDNNPYEFYVAGEHMDTEDLTIRCKGLFATDDVGPAFTRIFKKGQILYGSRRTYLKKVAVADFDGICSNTTFVLESKNEHVFCQKLLPFIMLTDSFTKWSISHSKGSTNPYILFSDLANYVFELPSLEEQRVLADKLWAAYEVKESYKNLLAQIDKLLHAQFEKMFGDVENTIYDLKDIKSFADCYAGATPSTRVVDYWENGNIPWMSSGEVHQGRVIRTEQYITQKGYDNCSTKMVPKHSIVIALAGQGKTRGTVAVTEIDLCTNQSLCAIIPNSTVLPDYLYYHLKGRYMEIRRLAANADGRGGLNLAIINKIKVIVPPMEKQLEFVSIAEQAEQTKASLHKGIEAIEAVIRSLIAEGTTKV